MNNQIFMKKMMILEKREFVDSVLSRSVQIGDCWILPDLGDQYARKARVNLYRFFGGVGRCKKMCRTHNCIAPHGGFDEN